MLCQKTVRNDDDYKMSSCFLHDTKKIIHEYCANKLFLCQLSGLFIIYSRGAINELSFRITCGRYVSWAHNKQIATIFKEAGKVERYGSGIKRVNEIFEKYGSKKLFAEGIQDGFIVTVYVANTNKQVYPEKHPDTTREKLLVLLQEQPTLHGNRTKLI